MVRSKICNSKHFTLQLEAYYIAWSSQGQYMYMSNAIVSEERVFGQFHFRWLFFDVIVFHILSGLVKLCPELASGSLDIVQACSIPCQPFLSFAMLYLGFSFICDFLTLATTCGVRDVNVLFDATYTLGNPA